MSAEHLIETIRQSVIGADDVVDGPYGARRVTYADYTASGRSLGFLEDYIRDAVLPLYANTHTESSGTGLQTSRFREEARAVIRTCVSADDSHAIVFCGSGTTAAINRLVDVLGIRIPSQLDDTHHFSDQLSPDDRPVVFIGPYEHHSNELPWRESIADVVRIAENDDGHIDLDDLEKALISHADRPLKIGSFSAASNVTGIISDVRSITVLLHKYGALSFWDFAAAAPYVDVEMVPHDTGEDAHLNYKDAVFISPHKFIGGPGTPGLLIARKELFANRVPAVPGGGTVTFVNAKEHLYVDDIEHREEGGTPAIVESIRAGLVFQLKDSVGVEAIRKHEEDFIKRAIKSWSANPNIQILGNPDADRLSIVSFIVRYGDRFLHHNFVVAVLNDLFGIQSRGGCSCAGPYGHTLLGINIEESSEFEHEIALGCEGIKPGWVRVNFNYFLSERVFQFILDAVHMVANRSADLLPYYRFNAESGLWLHTEPIADPPLSLHDIDYSSGVMTYRQRRRQGHQSELAGYLTEAVRILDEAAASSPPTPPPLHTTEGFEGLRWFPLPKDVIGISRDS